MGIALTEHQLMIVKGMAHIAENTANQLYHIMENHGLDKVDGFNFSIQISPSFELSTMAVIIGSENNLTKANSAGFCYRSRGKHEKAYTCSGKNSAEYEWLFADEAVKDRMRKILDAGTHPLPPDGLWIGDPRNDSPVDGWEWDVNDSLS